MPLFIRRAERSCDSVSVTFSEFLSSLISNPPYLITVVLVLAVILVNGWTDAPNAIATCVSTRAIAPGAAIVMAAICNFLGVLFMTMISVSVAETIFNIADFGGRSDDALIALCAAMLAIVIWAVAAWAFGIPTSESHALVAGITGAAVALYGSFDGININEWIKVIVGLLLSTLLGFAAGFVIVKLIVLLFRHSDRCRTDEAFGKAQVFGGAAMAFMHGAQDGQKFMGVFLLGICLADGKSQSEIFSGGGINVGGFLWLILLCSLTMGLGTAIGGKKIIKSVGMDMVRLDRYEGFAADIAAAGCLLLSSLTGIPVSTTHTKTTAIMGVGAAKRVSNVKWSIVREMVLTWVLTFPGCGLIAYVTARILMKLF